jgi:hypothetical protein
MVLLTGVAFFTVAVSQVSFCLLETLLILGKIG